TNMTIFSLSVLLIGTLVSGFFIGRTYEMKWGLYKKLYKQMEDAATRSIALTIAAVKTLEDANKARQRLLTQLREKGIVSPIQIKKP
ncbi:MAG: hypothetical protein KGJ13_12690, partial [Patescibacteria group bacterium]|nr:hypothetical protein [Patescibacteria group bacterium]